MIPPSATRRRPLCFRNNNSNMVANKIYNIFSKNRVGWTFHIFSILTYNFPSSY